MKPQLKPQIDLKTSTQKSAHPIDAHVGARLRLRRKLLGMSQTRLGDAVGLTFQQIQKYERGANRIGASRLFEFGEVLDVPISYFFDDLPESITLERAADRKAGGLSEAPAGGLDPWREPQSVALVRAYGKIHPPATRRALFSLAKALAKAAAGPRPV